MSNNNNSTTTINTYPEFAGSVLWIVIYCIIVCATVAGNILTIFAITISRQLSSTISNQFIFSLAVSDLLVGLSVPYHMCFYLIESFGKSKRTCIIRFVLITFACASSIYNLFFISTDRYIAIVYPLRYNRYITRKVSIVLTSIGWLLSLSIATVPIYWNLWYDGIECETSLVLPLNYLHFLVTPMFVLVWIAMLMVYMKIWREASEHAKRMRNVTNSQNGQSTISDTKSIQVVLLTLGCFSLSWIPYFIVITYFRIHSINSNLNLIYEITFTMAVANSGMNPIIYAWKNTNFRRAFWCLLTCQSSNSFIKKNSYITNHIPNNNLMMMKVESDGDDGGACNGKEADLTRSELNNSQNNCTYNNETTMYEDIEKNSSVTTEITLS